MYSWEIEQLIELKNHLLDIYDYCEIIKTSPQIDHVLYKNQNFHLFTTDDYHFKFKIKQINKTRPKT